MSLTQEVAALVAELGSATVDDLLPELEGFTRAQVMSALGNARYAGLIDCDGVNIAKSRKGKGAVPGVYRAKPEPVRAKPPASVVGVCCAGFGLAAGLSKQRQSDPK